MMKNKIFHFINKRYLSRFKGSFDYHIKKFTDICTKYVLTLI